MDWNVLSNSDKTNNMPSPLNSFRDGDLLVENTDDYIVGDRVWVNGRKPGYIQYLGETQFASGDWAGVVLDDPIGKNDGSVSGVRYFQCEPRRGVFARLNRLTRYPTSPPTKYDVHTTVNGTSSKTTTTKVMNSPKGNKTVVTTTIVSNSPTKNPRLRIADRVLVNSTTGVRTGVLRYLGPTAFASGQWAGIELDEPVGKNDGSVAGKRYFDCRMKYGLFAPIHKVTKISGGSYVRVSSPVQRSHESLTTSTTSSRTTMKSPVITSMQSTTTAMQEALKEKEEHLEQLLRERDLERAEIARAASEIKQAEENLGTLQAEHDQYMEQSEYNIAYLRQLLDASEQERKELAARLDEERRKVEDLQFRIEEESIIKDDFGPEEPLNLDHTMKHSISYENNKDEEKNGEIYSDQEEDKDEYIRKLQSELDDRESQMMQLNATLQETQLKLEQLADSYVSRNTINHQISQLQAENILLIKEKEDIMERWEETERMKRLLEEERDQLMRERVEQQAAVSDRDLQVAQLKAEVERLRLEFAQHKEDLKQQLEQTELETQAMQDLHQQLELERDALDELQDELRTTMNERDKLKEELTALKRDHELLKQSAGRTDQDKEITR